MSIDVGDVTKETIPHRELAGPAIPDVRELLGTQIIESNTDPIAGSRTRRTRSPSHPPSLSGMMFGRSLFEVEVLRFRGQLAAGARVGRRHALVHDLELDPVQPHHARAV